MEPEPFRGGIGPMSGSGQRGAWLAVKPAEHSRICWAAALGTARHREPLAEPETIPGAALAIYAEGAVCLCKPQPGHTRGRTGGGTARGRLNDWGRFAPEGHPGQTGVFTRSSVPNRSGGRLIMTHGDSSDLAAVDPSTPDSRPPGAAHEREDAAKQRDLALNTREALADTREALADSREDLADTREASQEDRERRMQEILNEADQRDERADKRDEVAESRDVSAYMDRLMDKPWSTEKADDVAHRGRIASASDRRDSKDDRTSSADDRSNLSQGDIPAASPEPT